jgi:hypothetical protein
MSESGAELKEYSSKELRKLEKESKKMMETGRYDDTAHFKSDMEFAQAKLESKKLRNRMSKPARERASKKVEEATEAAVGARQHLVDSRREEYASRIAKQEAYDATPEGQQKLKAAKDWNEFGFSRAVAEAAEEEKAKRAKGRVK